MNCYVCDEHDRTREAVAVCHNCSAGLCREHLFERRREVTTTVPLGRTVTLPIAAREILCHICKKALEQPRRVAEIL
jgi:hypothetical protein